jgi:hypothetical protein
MMILAANMILNNVIETPEVSEYVQDIRNLQVGVYELPASQTSSTINIMPETEKHLSNSGWDYFVRVRQENNQVTLFYKQINEHMLSIYVVVLDKDRLVIAEVQGHLDSIIQKALQELESL